MAQQPFYGKFSSLTPTNSQITIITGDTTSGSNQITNVGPFQTFDISLLRVGQILRDVQSKFGQNVLISDITGTTITVTDLNGNPITATSTSTGAIFPVDLTEGNYFIASASFFDPNTDYVVTDITGSNETSFTGPTWATLGIAARISNGNPIKGRFHEYAITDVVYRNLGTSQLSFFIEWNEDGVESDSGDTLYKGTNQTIAAVTLTPSESLAPIFSDNISGLSDLYAGSNFAGYQILIDDYLDNLVLTDIFYTGSNVLVNTQNINFSGSGVEVTLSGSKGVLVDITNDTLTSFYTGSAVLTEPTNNINFSGSGVTVASSGSDGLLVNITNDTLTTFYTGSSVLAGNTNNINFTGSGVTVETSGSDGVLVTITGGGGSGETYSNSTPTPLDFPNGDDPSIPAGTTFSNKTFSEMMDLMLYPELFPTLTNPSNTFTMSPSGYREIGETISTITLSATFNRGSISPAYGTDGYRSGLPNTYVYTGTGTSDNASTSLTDTETVSSYTVTLGTQSWTGAVSYDAGQQPLSSKGNNYDSPLSAGTTSAITRSIIGVYPVFATTSTLGTLTKQSLQSMSALIQVSMVAEDGGGDKQTIDIPTAWSTISGLQQFNTLSNSWDTISLSTFSTTSITKTIQGNTVNYTRYTHNGSTIGARQLRFTV